MNLGERVKYLRLVRVDSSTGADRAGCRTSYVSMIGGGSKNPTLDSLKKKAEELGCQYAVWRTIHARQKNRKDHGMSPMKNFSPIGSTIEAFSKKVR